MNLATINERVEKWRQNAVSVRRRGRHTWRRLALLLAVLGPGLITSNVDNDAGGISTYSLAGAQYGYLLLWSLIPMTIALYVTEEMCARMAVVTGKGLSDLIREEFGFRPTFFVMVTGFLVDLGNVVAEFGRGGLGHGDFRRQPLHRRADCGIGSLDSGAARHLPASGKGVSGAVHVLSCVGMCLQAIPALPDWLDAARHTVIPTVQFNSGYLLMLTALVGTTIAPWQFFYLQASFVEKRVGPRQYAQARGDVIAGSITCMIIVFFIIVATAGDALRFRPSQHHRCRRCRPGLGAAGRQMGRHAVCLWAYPGTRRCLAASILPLSTAHA